MKGFLALSLLFSSLAFGSIPSKPKIDNCPSPTTATNYKIGWSLWSGYPGTSWELLDGMVVLYNGNQFDGGTAHTQFGSYLYNDMPIGTHTFVIRLCNTDGCNASSGRVVVKVTPVPTATP